MPCCVKPKLHGKPCRRHSKCSRIAPDKLTAPAQSIRVNYFGYCNSKPQMNWSPNCYHAWQKTHPAKSSNLQSHEGCCKIYLMVPSSTPRNIAVGWAWLWVLQWTSHQKRFLCICSLPACKELKASTVHMMCCAVISHSVMSKSL